MNNYTQPYFGGQMQQPYGYQPAYANPTQNIQPQIQKIPQTDLFPRLQGKSVDSIDVVKAMDIPLDGTVSYFPLTDGSAIVTKQLQQDGTSRTIVYKPIEPEKAEKLPKYITQEDLEETLKGLKNTEKIEDNIKEMKRKIEDIADDVNRLKNRKD